jgi:hypothetical protein
VKDSFSPFFSVVADYSASAWRKEEGGPCVSL